MLLEHSDCEWLTMFPSAQILPFPAYVVKPAFQERIRSQPSNQLLWVRPKSCFTQNPVSGSSNGLEKSTRNKPLDNEASLVCSPWLPVDGCHATSWARDGTDKLVLMHILFFFQITLFFPFAPPKAFLIPVDFSGFMKYSCFFLLSVKFFSKTF